MHNNSLPLVPDSNNGLKAIQLRVQHLHKDLLSLAPNILASISWSQCCPTYPSIFLNSADLHSHQQTCSVFTMPPPALTFNYSTTPTWALAFTICPTKQYPDLKKLINTYPDDLDHATTLPVIVMMVSQWCYDHSNPPASLTVTNHVLRDSVPRHKAGMICLPASFLVFIFLH
jgi:hypothetical protein